MEILGRADNTEAHASADPSAAEQKSSPIEIMSISCGHV
jgi:hypothetical protein